MLTRIMVNVLLLVLLSCALVASVTSTGARKAAKDVTACVVFFTYGGAARYEDEVTTSITRMEKQNPDVVTYLVTDNENLAQGVVDNIVLLDLKSKKRNWIVRLQFLVKWGELFPSCDVTISLDSHVTACNSDLRQRMVDFYLHSPAEVGSNYNHYPAEPWSTTPYTWWAAEIKNLPSFKKYVPHNFALMFKNSIATRRLFDRWLYLVMKRPTKDDQVPLMRAASVLNMTIERQTESFLFALKGLHPPSDPKLKLPRFTYKIHGKVTLVHSHSASLVPSGYGGDICKFINENADTDRMMWHQTKKSRYQMILSREQCESMLKGLEPRICRDMTFNTSW